MKNVFKLAFAATIPVMTGYLVLGFGFGLLMKANGFSVLHTFAMSALIYAGSMQYVLVSLMTGGASLVTVALTTLMVNARHLFYGISMIGPYRGMKGKPYLMFGLTDETYSLVCTPPAGIAAADRNAYYLLVTLLDQCWWVLGSVLGAVAGTVLTFNTEGVDFALTALFVTVFTDQWLTRTDHGPALIGVGISAVCLVMFGAERFLIPAMLGIALVLCMYKEGETND